MNFILVPINSEKKLNLFNKFYKNNDNNNNNNNNNNN